MACIHVISQRFHVDQKSQCFRTTSRNTDLPFLVTLEEDGDHFLSGRFLRASDIKAYAGEENVE
jgi:nitrate reductase alpha subunit